MEHESFAWLAGESSGDFLASLVLPELSRRHPSVRQVGVGGSKMRASGLEVWADASALSVMGYVEVLRKLPSILLLRQRLLARLARDVPRVFIGVDAPDFNLGIEGVLTKRGIPCVHMVSPSIWAWRPERIEVIRRVARHVLLVFPFEEAIYRKAGIPATYIGHPLAGLIPMRPDAARARAQLGLHVADEPVLAVLPGSRVSELSGCAPVFFAACEKLCEILCGRIRFLLPAINATAKERILSIAMRYPRFFERLEVTVGQSHTVLEASDVVLAASGTATLEAALFKRPVVVGYTMSGMTAWLMKRKGVASLRYVSLPNILAGEPLVPEFLHYFCTSEAIAYSVLAQLEPKRRDFLFQRFTALHESLLRPTSQLACQAIESVLSSN